jgi:Protein of unknown function (DUF3800)
MSESNAIAATHAFTAFFDEASDDNRVFLMAGWLGSSTEWEKFSDAWESELGREPGIKYFKHNEAVGLKDQFADWLEKDRDEKLLSLARIVVAHQITGFIGGVALPRFRSFFSHSVMSRRTLRSIVTFTEPYHFCCNGVIAQTLGHQVEMERNITDPVGFIFDEGVPFLKDCISNYPALKKVLPQKTKAIAGTIVPGNDKKMAPLQAADMLAGQALLNIRTKTKPAALDVMRARRIFMFNCLPPDPQSIPKAVNLLNVVWSTKQLNKIVRSGR